MPTFRAAVYILNALCVALCALGIARNPAPVAQVSLSIFLGVFVLNTVLVALSPPKAKNPASV